MPRHTPDPGSGDLQEQVRRDAFTPETSIHLTQSLHALNDGPFPCQSMYHMPSETICAWGSQARHIQVCLLVFLHSKL